MMKTLTLWGEIVLANALAIGIFVVMFVCVWGVATFLWLCRRTTEGPPAGWDYDGLTPTPHQGDSKGCAMTGLEPNVNGRVHDADNTYA